MLIIFDLDGTLLNTIADLGTACNHALEANGFPTHDLDEYPKLVGNGVSKLIERALPDGHKDEATVLRVKADFIPYYNEHNCIHTRPYEGIPELIAELRRQGHTLAVASNKYNEATQQLIAHYFPKGSFCIVLGERPGVPRKPDPQIVEEIRKTPPNLPSGEEHPLYKEPHLTSPQGEEHPLHEEGLGEVPGEVLIGDSDVDMQTAKNAGIPSIACTWGFCTEDKLLACKPDYVVRRPEEILQLITPPNLPTREA